MQYEIHKDPPLIILEFKEERIDYSDNEEFRSLLFATIEDNPELKKFILDLRDVSYFASSGIGALVALYKKYQSNLDYQIWVNEKTSKLFRIVGLSEELRIRIMEDKSLNDFKIRSQEP